jgi:Pectate lyase superfamily protein
MLITGQPARRWCLRQPGISTTCRAVLLSIASVMSLATCSNDPQQSSGIAPSKQHRILQTRATWQQSEPATVTVSTADPTGVTDARAAIQNAIDSVASSGGGVVRLSTGTYLLDSYRPSTHPWKFYNLRLPSKVLLTGDPGTVLRQGPHGRASVLSGADYVENDVIAVGTVNYQAVTFQSSAMNGGFSDLLPTGANDSTVTLANPDLISKFAPGDFVGIYSAKTGDVIESEISRVTSVDTDTGEITLFAPLARGCSSPLIANVSKLITQGVGLENLTIQGAVPLVVMETFDFHASDCHFVYDPSIRGSNAVTGLMANSVRKFHIEDSSFESAGMGYAGMELPQRNSQDVSFQNVTFKVASTGFGEYAAHWSLTNNHFWLYPDAAQPVGLVTGGLDIDVEGNDIHGKITAGGGSGALICDCVGPGEVAGRCGQVRYRGNTIDCQADGNNCMGLVTVDPVVENNQITAIGSAYAIKVEGAPEQAAMILNNTITVGTSYAIVLNSAAVDGSTVKDNVFTGSATYAIYVASPRERQRGGHLLSHNTTRGFQNPIFLDVALHPGTVIN